MNHTTSELNEKLNYINTNAENPKYSENKYLQKMFKKDLKEIADEIAEAKSREIIGFDSFDHSDVYLDSTTIYVAGKPSGWSAKNFNISEGNEHEVVYDGGTNWTGKLIFAKSLSVIC